MSYQIILQTKQYIEEHFNERLTLDALAQNIGYSKYHLNRLFKASTGQSIHNYLMERRLFEAAELLRETELSLVEIALGVGYASQQSFTTAFKQKFECTPQYYRRKYSYHSTFSYSNVYIYKKNSGSTTNLFMPVKMAA